MNYFFFSGFLGFRGFVAIACLSVRRQHRGSVDVRAMAEGLFVYHDQKVRPWPEIPVDAFGALL